MFSIQPLKNKGFTLVELAVVISIIIIISLYAPSFFSDMVLERQVRNIALQFHQDLLFIQNLAVSQGTDPSLHPNDSSLRKFEIYFYPSLNCYYVEADDNAVFISPTNYTGKIYIRNFGTNIKFSLQNNNFDSSYIAFNNRYLPFPSGGNVITVSTINENKILTVTISPIGRLKIDWIKK